MVADPTRGCGCVTNIPSGLSSGSIYPFGTNPVQVQPDPKTEEFGSGTGVDLSSIQWPTRCAFSECSQMAQYFVFSLILGFPPYISIISNPCCSVYGSGIVLFFFIASLRPRSRRKICKSRR
jgi:hypothetical protein